MAEHKPIPAVELGSIDKQIIDHYLYGNPNGAFYALTDHGLVFEISTISGRSEVDVAPFGDTSRGLRVLRMKKLVAVKASSSDPRDSPSRIRVGGLVRLIVFVSYAAKDLDDLYRLAGPRFQALVDGHESSVKRLTSLDGTGEMTGLYYLFVRKSGTGGLSVFCAEFTSRREPNVYQLKFDTGSPKGRPYRAPIGFSYEVGGDLVVCPDSPKRLGRPRSIGVVRAIVKSTVRLSLEDANTELHDAMQAAELPRSPS